MSTVIDFPAGGPAIGLGRKPKRFDIELYQGDDFKFYLSFSGASLDVTGWTAAAAVKKVSDKTVVSSIITVGAVDTVNKRFLVSIASDTLDPDTEYMYDVQVTDAGGAKRTFIGGKITTTEDVTE